MIGLDRGYGYRQSSRVLNSIMILTYISSLESCIKVENVIAKEIGDKLLHNIRYEGIISQMIYPYFLNTP